MIPWRRLSFLLLSTPPISWHTNKPLHIVPRQSTFFPSRSPLTTTSSALAFRPRRHQHTENKSRPSTISSSSLSPVSPQELAIQQSIASRRLDHAKRQLMALHDTTTTLDRIKTWRPLLLLARKGRHPRDLAWLQEMVEQQQMTRYWGLVPDRFDLHTLMYCYGVHGQVAAAERILDHWLPHFGYTPTMFTINTLLGCYQRNKAIEKALALVTTQQQQQQQQQHICLDVASYNTLLAMLDADAQYQKATQIYHDMPLEPDRYTFTTMLHVATKTSNATLGLPIYQHLSTLLQQQRQQPQQQQQQRQQHFGKKTRKSTTAASTTIDIATVNAMMTFQISVMKDVDTALAIFDDLCTNNKSGLTPDSITCNTLLDGLLNQQRNPGKTAAMMHQMEAKGYLVADHVTYSIMMEAEVMMGDLHGVLALFKEALEKTTTTTTTTTTTETMDRMMGCLAKAVATMDHDHATMEQVWAFLEATSATATTRRNSNPGYTLDVKAYNGLMHGLAKLGRADLAQALYDRVFRMHHVCVADVATFTSLMLAYINNHQVDDAMEIYYVLREQHYQQQQQRQRQQQRQQQQQRRPVIHLDTTFYTTLISALTETNNTTTTNTISHHDLDTALELFTDMRQLRLQPTIHNYTAMVHWCGRHGDADALDEVHRLIKMDMGLDPDVGIYNALMDAYNRTDQIDQVLYMWDTMLSSSSSNSGGSGEPGFDLATISIVLDACGHHHQPHRAKSIWSMLVQRQDIQLNTNNYNSYVECLCRVGNGSGVDGQQRSTWGAPVKETMVARWSQAAEMVRAMLRDGGGRRRRQGGGDGGNHQLVPLPDKKTFNTLHSFARKYDLYRNKNVWEQLEALQSEFRKRSLLD